MIDQVHANKYVQFSQHKFLKAGNLNIRQPSSQLNWKLIQNIEQQGVFF